MEKSTGFFVRWSQRLLLVLGSFVFIFVVLEMGLRIFHVLFRERGFYSEQVHPYTTFGFPLYKSKNGEKFISSRHGELFPLKKPNGTFRIICFGGSTTENIHQQKITGEHYPLLLQQRLQKRLGKTNIEVINLGNSSFSTAHSLILLELNAVSWKPDLVVLSHNINDLLAMYFPDFVPDYSNKYGHSFFLPVSVYTSVSNEIYARQSILRRAWDSWLPKLRLTEWLSPKLRDAGIWIPRRIHRKSYSEKSFLSFQAVFERNLRSFVAVANAHRVRVILASQPFYPDEAYFSSHIAYKPYNDVVRYPLHPEFVKQFKALNGSIEKVAKGTNSWFLDNDRLLNGQKKYFDDFVHYSKEGLDQLADNYADFMLKNGLIQ